MRVLIGERDEWRSFHIDGQRNVFVRPAYRIDPNELPPSLIDSLGDCFESWADRGFDFIDRRVARFFGMSVVALGAFLLIFNIVRGFAHGS